MQGTWGTPRPRPRLPQAGTPWEGLQPSHHVHGSPAVQERPGYRCLPASLYRSPIPGPCGPCVRDPCEGQRGSGEMALQQGTRELWPDSLQGILTRPLESERGNLLPEGRGGALRRLGPARSPLLLPRPSCQDGPSPRPRCGQVLPAAVHPPHPPPPGEQPPGKTSGQPPPHRPCYQRPHHCFNPSFKSSKCSFYASF